MYISLYMYRYIHIYISLYMYRYIHMYISIHIYTHSWDVEKTFDGFRRWNRNICSAVAAVTSNRPPKQLSVQDAARCFPWAPASGLRPPVSGNRSFSFTQPRLVVGSSAQSWDICRKDVGFWAAAPSHRDRGPNRRPGPQPPAHRPEPSRSSWGPWPHQGLEHSIQFILNSPKSQITNPRQSALQSVDMRLPWPLTFDLTSDQEQLPRNRKKNLYGGKKR